MDVDNTIAMNRTPIEPGKKPIELLRDDFDSLASHFDAFEHVMTEWEKHPQMDCSVEASNILTYLVGRGAALTAKAGVLLGTAQTEGLIIRMNQ